MLEMTHVKPDVVSGHIGVATSNQKKHSFRCLWMHPHRAIRHKDDSRHISGKSKRKLLSSSVKHMAPDWVDLSCKIISIETHKCAHAIGDSEHGECRLLHRWEMVLLDSIGGGKHSDSHNDFQQHDALHARDTHMIRRTGASFQRQSRGEQWPTRK